MNPFYGCSSFFFLSLKRSWDEEVNAGKAHLISYMSSSGKEEEEEVAV